MAGSPPSITRQQHTASWRHKRHVTELTLFCVLVLALAGVAVMLHYWPFRYREVHPLLEHTFRSRVTVKRYHRTYFPHPGYVAEGITFHRHGDMQIPPLATLDRMTVVGTWTNLIFHPHELYEIRLDGLHVQIPPPGTKARTLDFKEGVVASSSQKVEIETIVSDGTTLDFLGGAGKTPLSIRFPTLQVHNVKQGQPLSFSARVLMFKPKGIVVANGSIGPLRSNDYGATPLSGTYSLLSADLSQFKNVSGHVAGSGHYIGTFSRIETSGQASVPDFRVASAHVVRLDSTYRLSVDGTNGDVQIHDAQVKTVGNVITAEGSVAGSPNRLSLAIATKDSHVEDLLSIIESEQPSVRGMVSFHAAVNLNGGGKKFLQRLALKGGLSLDQITFAKPETQQEMNAFAARVQKDPSADSRLDPPMVTAAASSPAMFREGLAYFQDIHITCPGTDAHLHGTFNLMNTRIHLTGKVALQQNISHAVTGWKSMLLKPLIPFFRHNGSGAVVSIAVTGTAKQPKIEQNLLHDK
jgi:hypothetical protein